MMPIMNKRQWLKKLFDLLSADPELSTKEFKIYIIEPNEDEQIEKIVEIPEYSPFTANSEQILVEWYCDNIQYSKTINNKIN